MLHVCTRFYVVFNIYFAFGSSSICAQSHRRLQEALGPEHLLRLTESWEELIDVFVDVAAAVRDIFRGDEDARRGIATLKAIFSSPPKKPSMKPSSDSTAARESSESPSAQPTSSLVPKVVLDLMDFDGFKDMYTMAMLIALFVLLHRLRWLRNRIRRIRRDSQ